MLIVPGARPNHILPFLMPDGHLYELLELITAFANSAPKVLDRWARGFFFLFAAGHIF